MAEINDIVSKQAIEGIKAADTALIAFDATAQKTLAALTNFTAELKKQGITYKDLAAVQRAMADEKKKATETEKQAAKILRETEKAYKAQEAAMSKLIAKEKAHHEALKLEVKTVSDAVRQNKALTAERNKLDVTTDTGKRKLQEYNAALTKNTEFIRQNGTAMEKQRMNIGNYSSAFDGIGSKLAGAFSVTAVIAFGKAAFTAFEEQEQANRKLLFALKGNKTAFKELTAQANDFQSRTGIADDAIQGIQVLAAESGKGTEEIKKITEATINWSKITGQDLQSAYLQINATLSGTAGRLTRVDQEFGKLSKSQLEAGAAIDLINTKYKDFAENAASDTEKLSANWSEFMESVGSGIAKVAVPALSALNQALSVLGSSELSFSEKLNVAMTGNYAMAKAALERKKADDQVLANQKQAAIYNDASTKSLIEQAQAAGKAKAQTLDYSEAYAKYAETHKKETVKQIGAYAKLQQSISDTKEKINDLLAEGKQPSNELLTKLQNDEAQLKAVAKAAEFAALKLVALNQGDINRIASKGITGVTGTGKVGKSPLKARTTTTGGAPTGTELFAEGELSQLAIEAAQATTDATFEIIKNSSTAEYDLKLSLLEKEKEAKLSNAKLTEAQKAKIEADYAKKSAKLKTEQFKKDKAAAIIQSIINTALAVVSALKTGPAAAIIAGIAGAAQTAVIASQKVPQFDAGTAYSPSTFIAGERRPEFMIDPAGRVSLVTKPTLFKNKTGSTIIGGEQTKKLMEQGVTAVDLRPDILAMRNDIVNTIKNKRELHISGTTGKITEREGNYYKTYFNRKTWVGRNN